MIDALLDTSVLVDLLRGFQPAKDWFAGLGRLRLAITPVVWMETVQGATSVLHHVVEMRQIAEPAHDRSFVLGNTAEDDGTMQRFVAEVFEAGRIVGGGDDLQVTFARDLAKKLHEDAGARGM